MSKINTGSSYEGPYQWSVPVAPSITLRDWFAGQALVGLLTDNRTREWSHADIAEEAYCNADAMLAQREKQP